MEEENPDYHASGGESDVSDNPADEYNADEPDNSTHDQDADEPDNDTENYGTDDDGNDEYSIYGILGEPLESHLIVYTESSHNKRRAQKTDAKILTCIWKNGGCTAKQDTDRFKKEQACQHDQD